MEQTIPIEECAKQRLQVLVYSYMLFTKHLMEEGVDRETVKRASDKVWATLGMQAAEQLKPVFGDTIKLDALDQAGTIAEEIHGMEVKTESTESEIHTEFVKCPWHEASTVLGIPEDWQFCPSGHVAFTETMYKALNPKASYKLTKAMPSGDRICEGISSLGP